MILCTKIYKFVFSPLICEIGLVVSSMAWAMSKQVKHSRLELMEIWRQLLTP
jgi:hypothetical protein